MKVVEVQFEGHVRMPDSQRGTNVIRCGIGRDNAIGGSVMVDTIEEVDHGIRVSKTVERPEGKTTKLVTFTKLYAWNCINEVIYAPTELTDRDKHHSQPGATKK